MDVSFPEPSGSCVIFYEREIKDEMLSQSELEQILSEAEEKIDKASKELSTGKYSIVDYDLSIFNTDSKKPVGELIAGGFLIGADRCSPEYFGSIENKAKSSFRKIREEHKKAPFRIYSRMYIAACRDFVSKIIKAKDPSKN